MSFQSSGKPIVNMLFEFNLVFSFDEAGNPVFTLFQDGKVVTGDIIIQAHTATLSFTLSAPGLNDVNWASNFQWLNPENLAPTSKPTNLAFIRDNNTVVTMIDSNPVVTEGDEQAMHFLFSVVHTTGLSATMYTSPDPVIINKKPPV